VTKIFGGSTRWENFIYYTQILNVVETSDDTFNGKDSIIYDGNWCKVVSNQNKGKAFIYGFSSDLTSLLNESFKMTVMINYAYGRIKAEDSETPLSHIYPFMARFQLTYLYRKISTDFFINYNGWKRISDYYQDPGGEDNLAYATPSGMPAWFTLNLRGSFKLNKCVTFLAGIENILDTQYRTFASGINAPGRNVFLAVKGNF
jgi:hemoglobin/transferrin/lactoferrin receptor protein